MLKTNAHILTIKCALAVAVLFNGALWFSLRAERPRWTNVPPAPSETAAVISALGDRQFAYRTTGVAVQNFGDTGGRVINLAEYDYSALAKWFMLEHKLDPRSNFAPALAGFFFGASRKTEALAPIIDYLEVAGKSEGPQKWRWLVQAIYLARHKMGDLDRALRMANDLAVMDEPGMPPWTRQMPAFVLNAQGEKEAALALMMNILKSEGESLHPNDVNAIRAYICEQIFQPEEAAKHELCENL